MGGYIENYQHMHTCTLLSYTHRHTHMHTHVHTHTPTHTHTHTHPVLRRLDCLDMVSVGESIDGVGREIREELVLELIYRKTGRGYVGGGGGGRLQQWIQL